MAQFSALPAELHLKIASTCSSSALGALCRTSRLVNTRYTKRLYANVNLHCHDGQELKHYLEQSAFLRTLKSHPEYARYVQYLKWTLLVLQPGQFPDDLPCLPSYSNHISGGIWEILPLLTEVIWVEIDEYESCGYIRTTIPRGLSLFPKASIIAMEGCLTDTFAHAVLPVSKASHLQHLRLVDVDLGGTDMSAPDSTIRLLNSLTGRCVSLKTLVVKESNLYLFDRCSALGQATASEAYLEFLGSVRETLVHLWFACRDCLGNKTQPDPDVLSMMNKIYQTLKRGTWPHLRNVTLLPEPDKKMVGK